MSDPTGSGSSALPIIVYKAGYASPIRTPNAARTSVAACGQLKSATERERKSRARIAAEAGLTD